MSILLAILFGGDRSSLYRAGKVMGDVNALQQGKVARRAGRRVAGKATGRTMGKLFS